MNAAHFASPRPLREELSEIIGFETDDPRLLAVEVTEVHRQPGRPARHRPGGLARQRDGAESNRWRPWSTPAAYFRHELATRLSLRHVPELHFERDKNPDVESRIDFLLKRAKKSRGRTENQP